MAAAAVRGGGAAAVRDGGAETAALGGAAAARGGGAAAARCGDHIIDISSLTTHKYYTEQLESTFNMVKCKN